MNIYATAIQQTAIVRRLLICLFFISTIPLSAQNIIIADVETKETIPFATVLLKAQDKIVHGDYTSEKGKYKVSTVKFDTAEISCIGYKTKTVPAENLKAGTVFLEKQPYQLDEVKIYKNSKNTKSSTLGYAKASKKSVVAAKQGGEVVVFIASNYEEPKYIKSFIFKPYTSSISPAFRIHFYKKMPDTDLPGPEIVKGNIVQYVDNKSRKKVEADIAEYGIEIPPEGIFAGIEWLSATNSEGEIISPKSSEWYNINIEYNSHIEGSYTFYRHRLEDMEWKKTLGIHNASFGITVFD